MIKTVRDILRLKGERVFSVTSDSSVFNALEMMANENVGALLVMQDGKLVGIVSERDYARKVILKGLSSLQLSVREIMTEMVVYARPQQSVEECMAVVTEKRCRHLPVFEDGELVGVVSIGDLVKASIAEKEFIISQLENYIKAG